MAETFGVSRTVIREAIRILQTRGLLVVKPGIGSIVRHPEIDQFAEGFSKLVLTKSIGVQFSFDSVNEPRVHLETIIIKVACEHATAEDLRNLWNILSELKSLANIPAKFFERAVDYHRALAQSTHNPLLIIVFDAVQEIIYKIRRVLLPEPIPQEQAISAFRQTLQAIEANNPDSAINTMTLHHALVWEKINAALSRLDIGSGESVSELSN